ncbi:hypothetical protein DB346_05910 [Verrucomicrobia bacterium LW23]|nr:hypothetical protein DB346_05910 [Verrucomicrobia bacterium LW23]
MTTTPRLLNFPDLFVGDDAATRLEGRCSPRNRPILALRDDRATVLSWAQRPGAGAPLALSITVAIDTKGMAEAGGPEREIHVYAGKGEGTLVAQHVVQYEDPYQVLLIPLSLPQAQPAAADAAEPLILRLQLRPGDGVLWIFAPDRHTATPGLGGGSEYHLPHLVAVGAPLSEDAAAAAVLDRLFSLASLQSFSWKEGCVLDALLALHKSGGHPRALPAILAHLDAYGFRSGPDGKPGALSYENPRSVLMENQLDTIESTLPFAIIAEIAPGHPWLRIALDFWRQRMEKHGSVHDGGMFSSEGAYTVAYPMAAIGRLRGDDSLARQAQDLLLETDRQLIQLEGVATRAPHAEPGIYLRHYADGRLTHRNWARGLAWLMLGHVQTLLHVRERDPEVVAQLLVIAQFAAKHQRPDHLWSCYVHQPHQPAECAGSAGIAAAMALGAEHGLLPCPEFRHRAEAARAALLQHVSPQGFLQGCSQSNKAGEDLQRSNYRVTTPYASGLLGLLEVTLG